MADRVKLLAIQHLRLDGKILTNDDLLSDYSQMLVRFIEIVPDQEESLKLALETRDLVSCVQCLTTIWDLLIRINANDLAEWCLKQINEFKKMTGETIVDHEKIEADITNFITILSTLSIDIQMALYQWAAPAPVTPAPAAPKVVTREKVKEKRGPSEKIILAVDDAPFFLTTLKSCLRRLPYKLFCVTSGAAALRFLQDNDPDLFVLDIEMPEMNGHELARRIKQGGHQAPIIFLTGNATEKNVKKALEAGAAGFIVKPINDELVVNKIKKFMED